MMQASGRRWTVLKNRQQRDPVAPALVEEVDLTGSAIAASSQGQGSPWWFGAPVACATVRSQCVCKCSGHCDARGHRYQRGCTAVDLLPASALCPQCACTVRGCGSPRLHSPLCAGHKGEWKEGPLEFVLTRCARKALPWLMPCDMTDFVNLYPRVRHDQALVIIIALLQEPRATASFVEKAMALAPAYSEDDLAAVLLETLDDIRSPTEAHRKQIQSLGQQGAARFTGVASTCREWGLIECVKEEQEKSEAKTHQGKLPSKRRRTSAQSQPQRRMRSKSELPSPRIKEEAEEEEQWHLGLGKTAYKRTGANERLGELLRASRDFRQPPEIVDTTTFQEMVSWAEDFD